MVQNGPRVGLYADPMLRPYYDPMLRPYYDPMLHPYYATPVLCTETESSDCSIYKRISK